MAIIKKFFKKIEKEVRLPLGRYFPQIRSRHPSHNGLRRTLHKLPFRSIVRLGSTTETNDNINRVEINSIQSIKNSASKLLMKQKFTEAGVKTAHWWTCKGEFTEDVEGKHLMLICGIDGQNDTDIPFPLVAKSHFGSRGVGNTKIDSRQELEQWIVGKNLNNYIFEEFIKMTREYRLHVTNDGCFYACRKLLKNDAPEDTWQRHDDVCSWALENNPSFKKPNNWNDIVQDCINAKNALGLDICAFDVMVQGSKDGVERQNPEWNICESCSAPSFGEITLQKYKEVLPKLIVKKAIEKGIYHE